jgi:hypothetical protein
VACLLKFADLIRVQIVWQVSTFFQTGPHFLFNRIGEHRNLDVGQTRFKWNEQSSRLVWATCTEDVVAVLNKADPSQHECFGDRDRDGGSEKRGNNTRDAFRLDVHGLQMICSRQ